jgi:hypothetical protein
MDEAEPCTALQLLRRPCPHLAGTLAAPAAIYEDEDSTETDSSHGTLQRGASNSTALDPPRRYSPAPGTRTYDPSSAGTSSGWEESTGYR